MRYFLYIALTLCLATSCFHTEWFEPRFEENGEYHNLEIPAEGNRYNVPFKFLFHTTKTSMPMRTHQIRGRHIIDGIPGEIYDVAANGSPIRWYWDWTSERTPGIEDAVLHIYIPANESSMARTISTQISIDSIANSSFQIQDDDEHNWGEWNTVLDGIQACW